MENFSNFITEQKNTHMTHIEDKVLYGGVDGTSGDQCVYVDCVTCCQVHQRAMSL